MELCGSAGRLDVVSFLTLDAPSPHAWAEGRLWFMLSWHRFSRKVVKRLRVLVDGVSCPEMVARVDLLLGVEVRFLLVGSEDIAAIRLKLVSPLLLGASLAHPSNFAAFISENRSSVRVHPIALGLFHIAVVSLPDIRLHKLGSSRSR